MNFQPGALQLDLRLHQPIAGIKEVGLDFVVFDSAASAAEALLDEQLGYVLALPQDITDTDLRLLESLPLDALLVPPQEFLTVQGSLALRRFSVLSRMPLLMAIQPSVSAGQLRSLCEAGVVGLVIDGSAGRAVADLRRTIDSLPPPGRRREERAEAILPTAAIAAAAAEEEEGLP